MLNELKAEIAESGAKVKVGIVIFNKKANVTDFIGSVETEYDAIKKAIPTGDKFRNKYPCGSDRRRKNA